MLLNRFLSASASATSAPTFPNGDPEMRMMFAAIALAVCFVVPQASSAEGGASQPGDKAARSSDESPLPNLLQKLGVNLISKAHAAECTQEGEICTSNEQCCSGLECTGGPPTTCTAED
jgi:hypothetical protein